MYSVGHNNIFIALMATSFDHNGHHQANFIQNLKMLVHEVQNLSSCMGYYLHQNQYLLTVLKCQDSFHQQMHSFIKHIKC